MRNAYVKRTKQLRNCHEGISAFCKASDETGFPGLLKMYVLNTWYLTSAKNKWLKELHQLTDSINSVNHIDSQEDLPEILLAGSPVFFPNYKLCGLITECGLSIKAQLDLASAALTAPPAQNLQEWLKQDTAPAYPANTALQKPLRAPRSEKIPEELLQMISEVTD